MLTAIENSPWVETLKSILVKWKLKFFSIEIHKFGPKKKYKNEKHVKKES